MNSTSFQHFQNDLKAAVIAGVPLEIGSDGSVNSNQQLTVARLGQIENAIAPTLTDDDSAATSFKSNSDVPARYDAAIQVFDRTDSMPIVLDGLTMRRQAKAEASRALRWTFIYLFVLLAVAFYGMWLYTARVIPMIDLMRVDLLLPAAVNSPPRFDPTPWFPMIVYLLGGACLLALILMLAGGVTKVAMWLGGNKYLRCRLSSLALRITQILVEGGTPNDEAIALACDLTGTDDKVRRNLQTAVADPHQAQNLESLADYFTLAGNDRLAHMKTATPIALVSIIGGVMALMYCVAVFWPIVSILTDMTTLGS